MQKQIDQFWSLSYQELFKRLDTSQNGLNSSVAASRLSLIGSNMLSSSTKRETLHTLASQFKNSIIILLIFATGLSVFLGNLGDAIIIFIIIFISAILGFLQEKRASNIVQKLLDIVKSTTTVIRDGRDIEIPYDMIVPGDLIFLNAGNRIPADCYIVESKDLFVNEAILTGETYPVEKSVAIIPSETPLNKRTNCIFMGTHIISGIVKALVINTGKNTEMGTIYHHVKSKPPETEFEHGLKKFGLFLIEITILLVSSVFLINVYFDRPVIDSFLFALALAIGLTPQLLPAIVSINLSHGAKIMAQKKVIVKKLNAIEDLGSMNILCSDKTGTLTEGEIKLKFAIDIDGKENEKLLLYGYINSSLETGFVNPIDESLRTHKKFDISKYHKLDEIPYDFNRKCLSILIFDSQKKSNIMITKGAVKNILDKCSYVESCGEKVIDITNVKSKIQRQFEDLSSEGFRIIGLSYRNIKDISTINHNYENDMVFLGFIGFHDPIKSGIIESLQKLKELNVSLKIISGDNMYVTSYVGKMIGLKSDLKILTGTEINKMTTESLTRNVIETDIFAEIEPSQKERIILALKKSGNVVGYLGDGINDAAAIHSADVGISVDKSTDVLKETADIVLLEKNIIVLVDGIIEGRKTFANTMKYIFMATSANFGNMFSMAGASLFLPFLPLLPKQILFTNLMTDFPEMTIATDNVDKETTKVPRHWDLKFIRKFMIVFGLLSTVFDFLTFVFLLYVLNANTDQFRTTWFIESVISASLVVLIIRSKKPLFKSKPGKFLLAVTFIADIFVMMVPFTPIGQILGFVPIPAVFYLSIGSILAMYIISAEIVKWIFYKLINT
ncbi:MAG: magnesium-translocating P-type ATPase [Nitrososphaeraceae archaeon]|nr:magnesium-translocating P-type ATPase [Nitrososphaeraceae archaeon]